MATFALSVHSDYACRRTGACCTSGWPIPVEPRTLDAVTAAVAQGRFDVRGHDGAHARVASPGGPWSIEPCGVLKADANGWCVFFESDGGNSCAIQRQLGHGALPSACRHFPRVCLSDARGTFVRLSHYCPTAARLLLRDDLALRIERDPPAFPAAGECEGLDATDALPPLLRPGVLHSLTSFTGWERFAVAVLARDDLGANEALALIGSGAEEMRAWTPAVGSLDAHVARAAARWVGAPADRPAHLPDRADRQRLAEDVIESIPSHVSRPAPVTACRDDWHRFVAGRWAQCARTVKRFLASHAFASWVAHEGGGVRTAVRALWSALAMLEIECVRACREADARLNDELLLEAIRATDLWLVHHAAPDVLARRLSRHEPLRPPACCD